MDRHGWVRRCRLSTRLAADELSRPVATRSVFDISTPPALAPASPDVVHRFWCISAMPKPTRWSEVSELLEDELLTNQELDALFEGLPKAGDGVSIDLAGFVEFSRKVTRDVRVLPSPSIVLPHVASALAILVSHLQIIDSRFMI